MTIKHQPVTPLPWERVEWTDAKVKNSTQVGAVFYGGMDHGEATIEGYAQDFDYIVHACNAYPKLVEVLHKARKFVWAEAASEVKHGINPADGHACRIQHELLTLLRELGETE